MQNVFKLKDGEPCSHKGCLSHISHPCEGCGRIAGKFDINNMIPDDIKDVHEFEIIEEIMR